MAGIEQLGGRATHIPFLAIKIASDLSDLEHIAEHLAGYRACLFVSANAVHSAWPVLTRHQPWPETLTAAVVGPGTARVLRQLGVSEVMQPEVQFDSEGLLALPFFATKHCQGSTFALIRGEGGRDLLARTLRE
ncbi:MAG: uroporphyrinogen-III synthase, partial [Fluviibacter sp.]